MSQKEKARQALDQARAGLNLNPIILDDINVQLKQIKELLMAQARLPLNSLDYWLHSMKLTIPANTLVGQEVSVSDRIPFDGRIKKIILHFPSGPQGLAGVFLVIEGEQVFPPQPGTFVALDDTTTPYDVDIFAFKGALLQFKGNNIDTLNPHTVRAQVMHFEEPKGTVAIFGPHR